jgi:hypothetical protein
MGARSLWGAFLCALAAVLLSQVPAQAHPQLLGRWSAEVPAGGLTVYEFGPGEYKGVGVWRGPFTTSVSNIPISVGVYELRLYDGSTGTLGLRDGTRIATRVGNVDLGAGALEFMWDIYRRGSGSIHIVSPAHPVPPIEAPRCQPQP